MWEPEEVFGNPVEKKPVGAVKNTSSDALLIQQTNLCWWSSLFGVRSL